jgi:tetratricopeptide (TPR) repeat protein
MKKFVLCCLLAVMLVAGIMPASAKPSLDRVSRLKKQGLALWQSDPAKAEQLYRQAFDEAMFFTRPAARSAQRERALALAGGCLHPSLFVEARLAMETYLSIYPQGRYHGEVLLNKALLLMAEDRTHDALEVLREARPVTRGLILEQVKWLTFHALIKAKLYRSAEAFLKEIHGTKTTGRKGRSVKRFADSENLLAQVMATAEKSEARDEDLARVEKTLQKTYFSSIAPETELLLLMGKDQSDELLHGVDVGFQERFRVSLHHFPSFMRIEKLTRFLADYPEAPEELIGTVVQELYSINRHEAKDAFAAEQWRKRLALVPGFAEKAELESLLNRLSSLKIDSPQALECLKKISGLSHILPFDNGWWPVYDHEQHRELLAISCLLNNQPREALDALKPGDLPGRYGEIPLRILFLIACDQRASAHQTYQKVREKLTSRERKMVEDFMFPLWKVVTPTERLILTSYLIVERFPKIAIDTLLTEICGHPDTEKLEHAFALLAELYQEYRNYMEAQKIWVTLRDLFPGSPWTK